MKSRSWIALLVLPLLAVLFGWGVLRLLALEADRLVDARAVLQERACCAGPGLWRGTLDAQELARRDCPAALQTLRWISRGIGDPSEEAKLAFVRCPGAAAQWEQMAGPPVHPALAAVPQAPAAPAAAELPSGPFDGGPAVAQPWVEHQERDLRASPRLYPLHCAELPPDCGGPCKPFSSEALLALTDKAPAARAAQLRAWLCDPEAARQAHLSLAAAARLLRLALPPIDDAERESKSTPMPEAVADGGSGVAEAERLVCALPWSAFESGKALLAAFACPWCETFDESGGDGNDGAPEPCELRASPGPGFVNPLPRVCGLAWIQLGFDIHETKLPRELAACMERAVLADPPARALARRAAESAATQTITRLRAKLPVGASDWTALAAASVLLDYEGHEMKPVRGPRSLVSGDAADQDAAIRARLLPLLAKAAPLADKPLPGLPDAGPPVFAQGPLRMLALQPPLGVVAQVCDDSPDSRGSLRALFWVREDRITVLEPPTLKAGFVEQMSGTLQLESCPLLLDVADLDGDGVPELLTAETGLSGGASGATVRVLTLSSPAAVRHTLAQSSREIAAKENAATGASHGEEGPKTDAGASE